MKYLIGMVIIIICSQCTPPPNYLDCYIKCKASGPFESCDTLSNDISPYFRIGWAAGFYNLEDTSTFTTSNFIALSGQPTPFGITSLFATCNNITTELYVNGVLVDSNTANVGWQNQCSTECIDGALNVSLDLLVP